MTWKGEKTVRLGCPVIRLVLPPAIFMTAEVGYRFEPMSNGGLQHPNKGITYGLIRFGTRF